MNAPGVLLRRQGVDGGGRAYLVRPTSGEDAEALVALREAVIAEARWLVGSPGGRSALEERLALAGLLHAGGLALTLEVDAEVVGQLSVIPLQPPQAHVGELSVAIAAAHRDRGLGSVLLATATEWARAVRLRRLTLSVLDDNARAIAAYERAGYRREGLQQGHVTVGGVDRDLVLMGLLLDQ